MSASCQTCSRWKRCSLVALVMLIGSLVPSPLPRHESWETVGPDKFLHFIGHGSLAVTLVEALRSSRLDDRQASVIAIVVSTTYGILLGKLQDRVPGRMDERADTIAGIIGSFVGTGGWLYLRRVERE